MTNDIINKAERVIATTYTRFPLVFTHGQGCMLYDAGGRAYTDFVAGIAVCNLGHAHPGLADAIVDQARRLVHVSNLYYTTPQVVLAEWLVEHSFADRVFFCNSGAEANEGAVKLARAYARNRRGDDRVGIVTMKNSFHGRTLGMISATGQEKVKAGFEPLLPGFREADFNDLSSVAQAAEGWAGAVFLEPVQGEGGVVPATPEFLQGVRELCDREQMLLICDEVQVGMGRTGELFAYQHYSIEPDVLTLAKALGGGLPLGAILAREEVASAFAPGSHASTFGGNAVATAAGEALLHILIEDRVLENCRQRGEELRRSLEDFRDEFQGIQEVRGKGLIVGMVLAESEPAKKIMERALQQGLVLNLTAGRVIRFLPPLTVTSGELQEGMTMFREILEGVLAK